MSRENEKKITEKCKACAVAFCVCLVVSIGLMVGGFFTPPQGKIDGSILKAVGELFAFAALAVGAHAVELGYDLKIAKGDTSVELNNDKKDE